MNQSYFHEPLVDRDREIALNYAHPLSRKRLRSLWYVDEKFGSIVASTNEPTIGEMRLLWWRSAVSEIAEGDETTKGEPLLERLMHLPEHERDDLRRWGDMAEGWHALLQRPISESELERFARKRGGLLFELAAKILEEGPPALKNEVNSAGRFWSLADFSFGSSDTDAAGLALEMARDSLRDIGIRTWPRTLRPLAILTDLAKRDVQLGGKSPPGSFSRVGRMIFHRLAAR